MSLFSLELGRMGIEEDLIKVAQAGMVATSAVREEIRQRAAVNQ